MAHIKNNGKLIINTTQKTQKYLELKKRPFTVYLQFGKGKANKKRPRVVVNWVKGLKKTRNKPLQQRLLQDAGVKVPNYFDTSHKRAMRYMKKHSCQIVGKLKSHSRGRGIKLFDDPVDLERHAMRNSNYYYQTYHDMNREWRIHVSAYHDEPVVAYRKCLRGEVVQRWREEEDFEKPWVRNIENCYFKMNSVEEDAEPWFGKMVEECKKAIDALDMDIAGVDIGENNKVDGGDFVIYEVNSASAMEEHTRDCYQDALEDIVKAKAKKKGLI